jgi:hypothetical protein
MGERTLESGKYNITEGIKDVAEQSHSRILWWIRCVSRQSKQEEAISIRRKFASEHQLKQWLTK